MPIVVKVAPPHFACMPVSSFHTLDAIDRLRKSHNAPVPYPTVHHFVTEMCAHFCYKNDALWDIGLMHCGICEMGL